MKKTFILIILYSILGVNQYMFSQNPSNKGVEVRANLKQAQYLLEHSDYVNAKKKAERVLQLDPKNVEATQLLSKCNSKINQQIELENNAYKQAISNGSLVALKAFVNKYPRSQYRNKVEQRIADYNLWQSAKNKNTKEAYEKYLQISKSKSYKDEANEAIDYLMTKENNAFNSALETYTISSFQSFISQHPNSHYVNDAKKHIHEIELWDYARNLNTKESFLNYLQESTVKKNKSDAEDYIQRIDSENDWLKCKDSNDLNELETYIHKYPNSAHKLFAQYKINLISGEQNYNYGNYSMAFQLLSKANNYQQLNGFHLQHLNKACEETEYVSLSNSNDVGALKNYLAKSSSYNEHFEIVSNRVAIILANNLTDKSTDYNYKEALSFAKDN